MVTEHELRQAIEQCEQAPTTFANCQKLAVLYTLQDYLYGGSHNAANKNSTRTADVNYDESEFLRAAAVADPNILWSTLDELMSVLGEINPRLYDGVMRRIKR